LRLGPLAAVADHFFTTRDLRLGSLDPRAADADGWKDVAAAIGVDCQGLVFTRQVHGSLVFDPDEAAGVRQPPEADAIVSGDPSRAISVRVADCVPLLLADPRTGLVGAAHAGWRGTAAAVATATVRALVSRGASAADLIVAVGPSIGPCCYDVGEPLIAAFQHAGHAAGDVNRWFKRPGGRLVLDLWTANVDQLVSIGLSRDHIHVARLCTACRLDLFCSYRKEGPVAGRLAAVIRAKPHAPPRP
jgi:YfiH family protein